MSRKKLKFSVALLTGHSNLTEWHSGRIAECAGTKKDSVHRVCHCPAMACKRYRALGCTFLKPSDLENLRVNGLRSLVANTRLGVIP
jgi:hypothetical protein